MMNISASDCIIKTTKKKSFLKSFISPDKMKTQNEED